GDFIVAGAPSGRTSPGLLTTQVLSTVLSHAVDPLGKIAATHRSRPRTEHHHIPPGILTGPLRGREPAAASPRAAAAPFEAGEAFPGATGKRTSSPPGPKGSSNTGGRPRARAGIDSDNTATIEGRLRVR